MAIHSSVLKAMDMLHHMKLYFNDVINFYIEQKKGVDRLTILVVENEMLLFVPFLIKWKKLVADLRETIYSAIADLKNSKEELEKIQKEIEFNNASEDNILKESKIDDVAADAGEDSPLGDDFNLAKED